METILSKPMTSVTIDSRVTSNSPKKAFVIYTVDPVMRLYSLKAIDHTGLCCFCTVIAKFFAVACDLMAELIFL